MGGAWVPVLTLHFSRRVPPSPPLVGRNVLFPGLADPLAVAVAVNSIVHKGFSVQQAVEYLMSSRGLSTDFLTRHVCA